MRDILSNILIEFGISI